MNEMKNKLLLGSHIRQTAPRKLVRAHFPAHQGQLGDIAGLPNEDLSRDAPYIRRSLVHQAEAAIAELLGVKASVLLTNGASQGLLVACLALGRRTRDVAITGDCHIAITHGMILADLMPVIVPSRRLSPTTEEILAFLDGPNPPGALILPVPSYRGEWADLQRIVVRTRELGIDLIIDEVHGTQLRGLPGTPPSALDLSCSLVIHSAHKYAGALVQGAVVHLPKDSPWEVEEVRAALALIDTTSRSNLIQASVEAALHATMPGSELFARLENTTRRVAELKRQLRQWGDQTLYHDAACADPRKLLLRSDRVSGFELARRLFAAGIDHEYVNIDEVLLVFSPANTGEEFTLVADALRSVRESLAGLARLRFPDLLAMPLRRFSCRPREAWFARSVRLMPLAEALGRCARQAVLYESPEGAPENAAHPSAEPRLSPGCAVLMPGERISEWHVAAIGSDEQLAVIEEELPINNQ